MKRTIIASLTLASVFTLAACSPGASGPDAEVQTVEQVRAEIETTLTDEEIIGYVNDACDAIKDGLGPAGLLGVAASSGIPMDDAGRMLGIGMGQLCPEQGQQVQDALSD